MELMILKVLGNLFLGNIDFFVSLILNNIFLTFGLFTYFVIIQGEKAHLLRFGVFMIFLWGVFDFITVNGGIPFSRFSMFWYVFLALGTVIMTQGTRLASKATIIIILWYQSFSFFLGG